MKKLNKTGLAMGVALAVASTGAFAGTFTAASSVVGVEAASTGTLAVSTQGSVEVVPGTGISPDNRVYIQLDNGATFNDTTYTLHASDGAWSATSAILITPTPKGATELEFRIVDTIAVGNKFLLSSSAANDVNGRAASVAVTVPAAAAGTEISIDANADDTFGTFDFFTAAPLFGYANEFSASVDTLASATIDVDANRNTFTTANSTLVADEIVLEFARNGSVNSGVAFTDEDKVAITLSGDMSTIKDITLDTGMVERGSFVISDDLASATFTADASDVFGVSTTITTEVYGSAALATRTFTVQSDLDFETETDKNLLAEGTDAGEWTINGLQAKVSHMSLNASGFVSWLKVANEGTTAAEISADIIYTLADGTEGSISGAALGTVDAGGVATVSEASILAAIGDPTQLVDASLTVTVAGQINLIHIIAEKKASDGRLPIPVYYNTAAGRNWVQ